MDLRRLRAGEWIVGAAGAALFVSLFLDWYQGTTGWQAFDAIDVVLLIVALSALGLALITALQRTPAIPIAMASIVTTLAFVALVVVAYRTINPPGDWDRSGGVWLALGSTLTMLAGSVLALRTERPGAPAQPVDAEQLPAPAP
jgi:uncharacterized membrane protein HdeD (DUF308 family)